jgi:hypothetical protein
MQLTKGDPADDIEGAHPCGWVQIKLFTTGSSILAHVKPSADQTDFLIFIINREQSAYDITEPFGKAYPKVQTG